MNSPHSISHHKYRKSGCSSANTMVIDLQPDSSSQEDQTGRQLLSTTPTQKRLLHLSPDIINRQHHVCSPQVPVQKTAGNTAGGVHHRKDHFTSNIPNPLQLIITGTAGTGKSYLIQCLRLLFADTVKVCALTGVASFIIDGTMLHQLSLPPPYKRRVQGTTRKPTPSTTASDVCHQIQNH